MNTAEMSINILNFIFKHFEHVQTDFVKRALTFIFDSVKGASITLNSCILLNMHYSTFSIFIIHLFAYVFS